MAWADADAMAITPTLEPSPKMFRSEESRQVTGAHQGNLIRAHMSQRQHAKAAAQDDSGQRRCARQPPIACTAREAQTASVQDEREERSSKAEAHTRR